MIIREERQGDAERIRGVNLAAFETSTEADLVDALRRRAIPLVSLGLHGTTAMGANPIRMSPGSALSDAGNST